MTEFSDDTMWQAVVDCDPAYDGKFFYGVKTVGVYCRPSCRSKTPLRKNAMYFMTKEEAVHAGFRPCKRCRPELCGQTPVAGLAAQAKKHMDDLYGNRTLLMAELKKLGVTQSHLAAVFRQQYGMPPTRYLGSRRVQQAKKMLAATDMPIIDIAATIGFDSLSAFYAFFKKQEGTTPHLFRVQSKSLEA